MTQHKEMAETRFFCCRFGFRYVPPRANRFSVSPLSKTRETQMAESARCRKSLRHAARECQQLITCGTARLITPTKPLSNQRDLSLAYSAWRGLACLEIAETRSWSRLHLARQPRRCGHQRHRRAGPGRHRPLAGKPVMEGKGCLFKKFAGIDVFDIELDEKDPDKLVEIVAARAHPRRHQPRGHQGARVLLHRAEAARAHEHPGVPRRPARHRDHPAALLNALELAGKNIDEVKVASSGPAPPPSPAGI